MRGTLIVKPVRIRAVNSETTYEGARELYSDSEVPYQLDLVRVGEQLNDAYTSLQVRYQQGRPGGAHDVIISPRDLMPRYTQRPFKFLSAFGEADTADNITKWYGQSDIGVKEYRPFNLSGSAGEGSSLSCSNWRLFSYEGDLYGLADRIGASVDGGNEVVVQLVRWNEADQTFYIVKRFTEDPVDTPETRRDYQCGSPDVVVVDGKVKIFWRVANIEEDSNRVVGYESEGDLSSWEKIADFEVEGSLGAVYKQTNLVIPYAAQKNFRLRVAYGGGTIMLAYLGVKDYSGQDATEFRTFSSGDGGATFLSHQSQILGVKVSGPDQVGFGRGSESLHPYFVPELESSASTRAYDDVNAKFGLYYDEDMGSFVILKAGDPSPNRFGDVDPSSSKSYYLMGVKTIAGDFTSWEPCLQLELTGAVTGMNYGTDPDSYTDGDGLYIYDLDVQSGAGVNTIAMSMRAKSEAYTSEDAGVVLGEFKFVSVRNLLPGSYSELFRYGVKTHEEYAFVCSSFDIQQAALVSAGRRKSTSGANSLYWVDVSVCSWRSQIVAMGRPLNDAAYYFAIAGPWSNMGESTGYQLSYARYGGSPWSDDLFNTVETSSGSVEWQAGPRLTRCYGGIAGTDEAYIDGIDTDYTDSPWERDGEDPRSSLKAKFTVKIDTELVGESDWVEFFRMGRRGVSAFSIGHEIRLRMTPYGNVVAADRTGVTFETLPLGLDLTKTWDMMVKIGPTYSGVNVLSFWYRENGTTEWLHEGVQTQVPSTSAADAPKLRLGYLDASGNAQTYVYIGDVFCGTSSQLYNHPFDVAAQGIEPMDKVLNVANGYTEEPFSARHAEIYQTDVELMDGSTIRFLGSQGSKDYGVDFTYRRSVTRNSSNNAVNGLAGSVWNFTNHHDYANDETDIVFENTDREDVDALTLVNMVGVSQIEVHAGGYIEAEGRWYVTPTTYLFSVPYEVLNVDAVDGNMIFLEDIEKYSTSELIGYSIMVNDGSAFTDALVVTDNYDGVIVCSSAVPTDLADEFRLMAHSTTFDLPAIIGEDSSHLGITLKSAVNVTSLQLGEVVFGSAMDISDLVDIDGFQRDMSSSFSPQESDRGFLHIPMSELGAVKESVDLKFETLGRLDDGADKVLRILNELYEYERPFPLVMEKDTGEIVTRLATVDQQVAQTHGGFHKGITARVDLQNWRVKTVSDYQTEAPVITSYGVNNSNPQQGLSVDFYVTAVDPQGETLTYAWDFGDNSGTAATASASYTYASDDVFSAVVTVTNESGQTSSKTLLVYVQPYTISYYTLSPSTATPTSGTEVEITVTAYDADDNVVTDDDETILTWVVAQGVEDYIQAFVSGVDILVEHEAHGLVTGMYVVFDFEDSIWSAQSGNPSFPRQITVVNPNSYTYTPAGDPSFLPTDHGIATARLADKQDSASGEDYGFDANDDASYSHDRLEDIQLQLVAGVTTQRYMPARTGTFKLTAKDNHGRFISQIITVS